MDAEAFPAKLCQAPALPAHSPHSGGTRGAQGTLGSPRAHGRSLPYSRCTSPGRARALPRKPRGLQTSEVGREELDEGESPYLISRCDDLHVRRCWKQPGALPFHKRLMDRGKAVTLF